ncbi:MAG: hypothetical protein UX31_C0006G0008 [Candidatus Nomurabacteria bacterium GW2011_GWA1_46_11]|uniref:Uncharacterized protein n=1 Tax=Candidatus Nomurabacteria bacterium GW2011_GWA1_46_11 TaxID=1618732 RepID=A0A0G1NNY2_9BACT|nr:MAG: hypothetical protein UX31_C0006G0008 [Candidatus Nomurabacteria bacterium GW2011_GWA1_46_11]
MQSLLVNPQIKGKIITISEYDSLSNKKEFLLYSDNILEGIAILNYLTKSSELLDFKGIVYEPIDQPIYIFIDNDNNHYGIKICGSFDRWELPDDVNAIKSFIDLPDYIFYSINSKKAILAGENTETASVGNSQWQREGRKVAAARIGVPFIYQTFYSGKDESQNTIREPNSLQVFNQLLYSARYKTPSLVAYFENNFDGSKTRQREPIDSQVLFSNYIKSVLLTDTDSKHLHKKIELEKQFFAHMIAYLKEGKHKSASGGIVEPSARIIKDLPTITAETINGLLNNSNVFIDDLIDWIYSKNNNFEANYLMADIDYAKLVIWNPSLKSINKSLMQPLLDYFSSIGPARSFLPNGKAGIINTAKLKEYLDSKYPNYKNVFDEVLTLEETVVFPTRVWKYSNAKLTLSPDPESGEIVAFCELLAYDLYGNKKRNVFGNHIVAIPPDKTFSSVEGKDGNNKINKAIATYFDLLILSNGQVVSKFKLPTLIATSYSPVDIKTVLPHTSTEEVAVVSTYLNQSTIKSSWELCFIHTHHSSWQQISINGIQQKINRVSTKLDLVMQQKNKFMLAEGKDKYQSILSDRKIKQAIKDVSEIIDKTYRKNNVKFDAFLYNLGTTPTKDPDYYVDSEASTVQGGIKMGHFNDIANSESYVVIIVYTDKFNRTKFRLVFSESFDADLKNQLMKEFI